MTDPRARRRRRGGRAPSPRALAWLPAAGAFMIVIAPVVLFAGAGNPPCQAATDRPAAGRVRALDRDRLRAAVGRDERVRRHRDRPEPDRRTASVRDRRRPRGDPAADLRARHPQPVRHTPRVLRRRHRRRDHRPARRHLRLAGPRRPERLGRPARHRHASAEPRHRQPARRDHPDRAKPAGRDASTQPGARPPLAARSHSPRASRRRSFRAASPPRPRDAPAAVKRAIAAGNQLISKPYIYGGGHGRPLTELDSGYDCSGATSYILHGAGAFGLYAEDSTELESFGQPGPGAWITVYANSGHAFIAVAGVVMNTAWYAPVQPTSPRAGRAGSPPRRSPPSTPATSTAASCNATRKDSDDAPPSRRPRPARGSSAAVALAGCGLSDPYTAKQPSSTSRTRPNVDHAVAASTNADPAPERGGTIPAGARARRASWRPAPAQPTPQAALERYARLYVNWTARTVAADQRELAAISVDQARAQALQAAASYAHDQTLQQSGVANSGHLVAITPSITTPGQWVLVTSEQTTGKGDYAGLPPTLHVIYAQVTRAPSGWVVSEWAPQN